MTKCNNEKSHIRNALESISKGDATGLKKSIKEALLSKVRKALNLKEKEVALDLLDRATKK